MSGREAVLAVAELFDEIAEELRRLAEEEPEDIQLTRNSSMELDAGATAAPVSWPRRGLGERTPALDDRPELIE